MSTGFTRGIRAFRVGIRNDWHVLRYEWKHSIDGKKLAFINFWRYFRQSWWRPRYYRGWCAQWEYPPPGLLPVTTYGWTRRKALKRYGRQLVKDNYVKEW